MGCLQSTPAEDVIGGQKNLEIERKNREDWLQTQKKLRLLLLGTGDSGKSTFMKQIKLMKLKGFPKEEREHRRDHVNETILDSMRMLCKACVEKQNKRDSKSDNPVKECLTAICNESELSSKLAKKIKAAWATPALQEVWNSRSSELLQVPDSLPYFIEHIDRVSEPGFVPNDQDIINLRIFTTGVLRETTMQLGMTVEFVDVGGQRNERKKWLHLFDDSDDLVYFVALSEFDQMLFEDSSIPRVVEALKVFEEVANNKYFKDTSLILYLNKVDLFRTKLCSVPFRVDGPNGRFQDYSGPMLDPSDPKCKEGTPEFEEYCDAVIEYIKALFIAKRQNKSVVTFVTNATDTQGIRKVFDLTMKEVISRVP